MIDSTRREARRMRYEMLDPDHRYQSIGYGYLTDGSEIELKPLPEGREY